MGNISHICCENTSNIGTIEPGLLIHESRFEPAPNFLPNLSTVVEEKLRGLSENPLHIEKERHGKSFKREPMKEVARNFIYDGEWALGQPDGMGKIYFSNGEYFEGEFRDGQANGQGRYIFADGSAFEGNVEDNKARGEGKYSSNEVEFNGYWEASKPSTGVYSLRNKTRVELTSPHHGKISYSNGDVYTGTISTELHPNGKGVMQFFNGNTYDGDWRDGIMYGQGFFKWANGAEYEGGYEKGKKHGMGTFIYPDGRSYSGEWYNGLQHGSGKLIKNGETIFDGFFASGEPVITSKAGSGKGKGFGVGYTQDKYDAFRAGDIIDSQPPRAEFANPEIPVYKAGEPGLGFTDLPVNSNTQPFGRVEGGFPQPKPSNLFSGNFNSYATGYPAANEFPQRVENAVRPSLEQAGSSAVNNATAAGTNLGNQVLGSAEASIKSMYSPPVSSDHPISQQPGFR